MLKAQAIEMNRSPVPRDYSRETPVRHLQNRSIRASPWMHMVAYSQI